MAIPAGDYRRRLFDIEMIDSMSMHVPEFPAVDRSVTSARGVLHLVWKANDWPCNTELPVISDRLVNATQYQNHTESREVTEPTRLLIKDTLTAVNRLGWITRTGELDPPDRIFTKDRLKRVG